MRNTAEQVAGDLNLSDLFKDGRFDAIINAGQRKAADLGLVASPSFVIDGQMLPGAPSWEVLKEMIDGALARIRATAAER